MNEQPTPPLATLLVPLAAAVILPMSASAGLGAKLAILFTELLIGLPCLLLVPDPLRPEILSFRTQIAGSWSLYVLACLLFVPALQGLTLLFDLVVPIPEEISRALLRAVTPEGGLEAALIVASAAILAPVMEEIFFRGLVPWFWRRRFGERGLLVGPAAFFALFHLNPWHFPVLFLLGLMLGEFRRRSGSLLPGILLHFLNNVTALSLFFLSGPDRML